MVLKTRSPLIRDPYQSTFKVKLLVVPVDPVGVLLPPLTLKIFLDIGSLLDGIIQCEHFGMFALLLQLLNGLGEHELDTVQALVVVSHRVRPVSTHAFQRLIKVDNEGYTYLEQNQIRHLAAPLVPPFPPPHSSTREYILCDP